MTPSLETLVVLLEVAGPITVFIIGALLMHRSGLLPQQKRLDGLLKDVIRGQEEQLHLRDDTIRKLREDVEDAIRESQRHRKHLEEELAQKDRALSALQLALAQEQHETATLRADVADSQTKMSAMVSHQRTTRRKTVQN